MTVLDKGSLDLMLVHGNDKLVVNAARVSFANEDWVAEFNDKNDTGLLRYLIDHKHVSPFYHPQLTFRVKAPISVQRQWFKHKVGTAENSESTRYIEVKDEIYLPEQFRQQSRSNKQGSGAVFQFDPNEELREMRAAFYKAAFKQYQYELGLGVAKEQARGVLPLDTYTSWVWTASLQAVIHFLELREEAHSQWEVRQYAHAMRELVHPYFPVIFEILGEQNRPPSI
jgi:thymidylate synthase (FAD)